MDQTLPSVETILAEAVAIDSPQARQAFVDKACGGSVGLKQQVERLIANHFRAGDFLDHPAAVLNTGPVPAEQDLTGARIGRYQLRERIGEGGMGVVYVAEQTEPIRRKVALKVIKPGMDSREVVGRFEAERQALALMDHPHIARVFDGGATDEGRPYFVMELVRGIPITDYCDQARSSPRERLGLLVRVCQAVQHAHTKGIIHRDLKPSNILVTLHDSVPVPKVIDFGVAKAVNQRLTEQTVYTRFAQMVGTPLYMSPEQAEMSGLDVDTRSDVYALGVLLYELLTGSTPFDRDTLGKAGFDEMRRIIREEEPARPSHRVSTLGNEALSTVSHKRGLDGRRLGQLLRGELDWIVLKALEKDRTRRYESASAFAADVECYLNDAPVQACPPSAGYRLRKFIRRHRGRVAAAALALTLAVIGVAVAGGFYRQAAGERERVAKQVGQSLAGARTAVEAGDLGLAGQRVAEARAGLGVDPARLAEVAAEVDWVGKEVEARQADAARFKRFLELTTDAQDQLGYGGNLERDKAAEEALAVYAVMSDDGWLSRLDGSHLTAAQKGQVREAAYVTLVSRADFQVRWLGHRDHKDREPKEWARRGMDMLARAASFHEPTRAFYFVRAACNGFLGNTAGAEADGKLLRETPARTAWDHYLPAHTAGWQGNLDEAIRGYEAALRVQPNHYNSLYFMACRLGSDKINRRPEAIQLLTGCIALRPHHVWAYTVRAKYREQLGQLAEAEADLTAAIVAGTTDQDKLYALMERRRFYERRGDTEKAAQDVRSELTLREKIFATQDAERPEAVISLNNLARLYDITGDRTKAEPLFLQALERSRRVLGEEHHQTSIVMNNLALLYHGQGQLSKAEPLFLQALEWSRRVLGEEHGETLIVMNNLGTLYHAHGQLAKAESLLAKNLEVCRRVLGAEHPDTLMSMNNLGSLYRAQGQYAKTEPLLVKALEVSRRVRGEEHPDTLISIRNVAALYETQGQFAKAEPLFREALVKVRKRYGDGQPMVAGALAVLGLNLLQQKKFADAEPLLRECLKIRVEKEPDDWLTFNAKSMLGGSLLGQKIHAEAEPLLLTGYAGLKQREATIPAAGKLRLLEAADRLVELYDATEKKDELAKWLKVQEAVDGGGTMLGPVHEVGQGLELKGRLDKESKALIYQMRLLAGQTYVLEMVSPNPEALDPVLRVKDSSGRRLAHDDDSAGNLNARIVFRANLDGIYRIQATSYGYVGQGEFTLRVGPKE